MTKNRPPRAGNQLMMKRLSRVFFGVPVVKVPKNSPLKKVKILTGKSGPIQCSLTFSDNGMDKITLPYPEEHNIGAYDNKILLFNRTGISEFRLSVYSKTKLDALKKKSARVGSVYKMSSGGRAWGLY